MKEEILHVDKDPIKSEPRKNDLNNTRNSDTKDDETMKDAQLYGSKTSNRVTKNRLNTFLQKLILVSMTTKMMRRSLVLSMLMNIQMQGKHRERKIQTHQREILS